MTFEVWKEINNVFQKRKPTSFEQQLEDCWNEAIKFQKEEDNEKIKKAVEKARREDSETIMQFIESYYCI